MENNPTIVFQQARDFSQKLNATFEFIRQNFKPLAKSLLYIAGPVILLGSLLAGSLYSGYFNSITGMKNNPNSAFEFITSTNTWVQAGAAVIFTFISGIIIISVVYNYMHEYNERKTNHIEVDAIWKRVRQSLPHYASTFVLFVLLVLAVYALMGVVFGGVFSFSVGLGILLIFVLLMLLVYIIVPLSLIFAVRAFEDISFFDAVGRCFKLANGKWWSTFALLFICGLVQSMLASVFFIPWYINVILNTIHSINNQAAAAPSFISTLINNLFLVLYFLATFLLYAIPLIALAFQYFNLVELKESRGLMNRIQSM